MVNIIKYPPALLIFRRDKVTGRFIAVKVGEMDSDETYYMVETRARESNISVGVFKKISHEAYDKLYPNTKMDGDRNLYLFIKRELYPSTTELGHNWQLASDIYSLSTSVDNDLSVSWFYKNKIDVSDFALLQFADHKRVNTEQLTRFFTDIQYHLEDMEIYNYLQLLRSAVSRSEGAYKRWEEVHNLYDAYKQTQNATIRNKLIYLVAVSQGGNPERVFKELFKADLLTYKAARESKPEEFYSVWARLFGDQNRSKRAKIAAVNKMMADLDSSTFDFNHIPPAAHNSSLNKLINEYRGFADSLKINKLNQI